MIATLVRLSCAALILPRNCGNATSLWAHVFPHASHNIPVECIHIESNELPAVVNDQEGVRVSCLNDSHCATLLQQQVFEINAVGAAAVLELADRIDSAPVFCTNTTNCSVSTHDCMLMTTSLGYCTPTYTGNRAWPSACFDGAHATCSELITSAIGVAVGFVGTMLYLALYF